MSLMLFLRYVAQFVLSFFFRDGELRINGSSFNPLKVLFVFFFVLYVVFSLTFINNSLKIHVKIEEICPGFVEALSRSNFDSDIEDIEDVTIKLDKDNRTRIIIRCIKVEMEKDGQREVPPSFIGPRRPTSTTTLEIEED